MINPRDVQHESRKRDALNSVVRAHETVAVSHAQHLGGGSADAEHDLKLEFGSN
jgi:hypothetical protein